MCAHVHAPDCDNPACTREGGADNSSVYYSTRIRVLSNNEIACRLYRITCKGCMREMSYHCLPVSLYYR